MYRKPLVIIGKELDTLYKYYPENMKNYIDSELVHENTKHAMIRYMKTGESTLFWPFLISNKVFSSTMHGWWSNWNR